MALKSLYIVITIIVVGVLAVIIKKVLSAMGLYGTAGSGSGLLVNVVGLIIFIIGAIAGVFYLRKERR